MLAMLMFFSLISLWRIAGSATSYNKLNGLRHFIHKVPKKIISDHELTCTIRKRKETIVDSFWQNAAHKLRTWPVC